MNTEPISTGGFTDLPWLLTGPVGHLLLVLLVLVSVVSFLGWGRLFRRILRRFIPALTPDKEDVLHPSHQVETNEWFWPYADIAVGYGGTSILYFLLYVLGVPSPYLIGGWLASGGVLGGYDLACRPTLKQMTPSLHNIYLKGVLGLIGGLLAINVLTGFVPPLEFDSLEYHLFAPAVYFRNGQLVFLEHNVYANFPQLVEIQYAGAMALTRSTYAGAIYGKLLNGMLFLISVWGVGRLVKNMTGRGDLALVSMGILMGSSEVLSLSVKAFVEAPYLYMAFCSATAIGIWFEGEPDRDHVTSAIIAGVCAGFAVVSKYPALLFLLVPVLLVVPVKGYLRGLPLRDWAVTATLAGGFALIATAPWLVRNTVNTGNPVYPLLYRVFNGEPLTRENAAKWKAAHRSDESILETLSRVSRSFSVAGRKRVQSGKKPDAKKRGADEADEQNNTKNILTWSPLLFLFLPLLMFGREGSRSLRSWAWLFGGITLFAAGVWWVFTHRLMRFLIPVFPLLAVLNVIGLCGLQHKFRRVHRYLIPILLFVVLISPVHHLGLTFISGGGRTARLVAGITSADRILTQLSERGYHRLAAIRWMNNNVSQNERVGPVGEAALFYLRSPVDEWTVFDRNPTLIALLEERPKQTLRRWDRNGIRWLLVNRAEMARYRKTYSYTFEGKKKSGYPERAVRDRLRTLNQRGWIKRVFSSTVSNPDTASAVVVYRVVQ